MPTFRAILVAVGACLVVLGSPLPAWAGEYYVDNGNASCLDVGPGTQTQPYCTITAAIAAHHDPGTTIIVLTGTYRETATIPSSGSSAAPLVIQGQGPDVIVDGADSFANPALWAPYSGSVFVDASITPAPKQVFVDAARLRDTTGTSPSAIPPNTFAWVSGQGLYVNLGADNPGNHDTKIGRRAYGFRLDGKSFVTIQGFHVTRTEDRGIYLTDSANDCVIRGNRIDFAFRPGIQALSSSRELIEGNVIVDNANQGISLTAGTTGCTVQDNECARNAVPNVFHGGSGIYLYGSSGNLIQRNRLHENADEGLNMQDGSNNNLSIQNLAWNNADHGFDNLNSTGITHLGDVAWRNVYDGFAVDGTSTGSTFYDCVAVDNGLTTDRFDLWVDQGSAAGFVSDYNIFWNSSSVPPVKYMGVLYSSVTAYSSASGQDAHTIQADPKFIIPVAGDFRLRPGSPAIDSGISSVPSWPATDVAGNPRVDDPVTPNAGAGSPPYADRGAFEYQFQSHVPTASLSVTPASGVAPLSTAADAAGSSDPDGTALSYSFDFGDGTVVGPQSGTMSSHTYAAGTWTIRLTVQDGYGYTNVATRSVNATPDRPPVVTAPAAATVGCGSQLTVDVSASDADGDAIASLTASVLPPGATFTPGAGNTSGTLSWTPDNTQKGSFTVTFTAANQQSGSASTTITAMADSSTLAVGDLPAEMVPLKPVVAPNPVRSDSWLTLLTTQTGPLRIGLYDLSGRRVRELLNLANAPARVHRIPVSGLSDQDGPLPSGVYFLRVRAVEGVATARILIAR